MATFLRSHYYIKQASWRDGMKIEGSAIKMFPPVCMPMKILF